MSAPFVCADGICLSCCGWMATLKGGGGGGCSLDLQCALPMIFVFVVLVISYFGFEGRSILVTFYFYICSTIAKCNVICIIGNNGNTDVGNSRTLKTILAFQWRHRNTPDCMHFLRSWSRNFVIAGRYSPVGSDVAWESSGTAIDPRVRHIFSGRFGHEIISTAILPLLLIQEEQLSVNGERMWAKH